MDNFNIRTYLAEGRLKVNEGDMDPLMQDLKAELEQHDWFYYMSDDPRIYDRGTLEQRELKRLLKMLNYSQQAKDLYNEYAPVQDGIDLRIEEEKRPDYPDVDNDGDTEESMEKALKDKEPPTAVTEEDAEGTNFDYDYADIGQFYLKGLNKPFDLTEDELKDLGESIVRNIYKGDIKAAYDDIVHNKGLNEENIGLADIGEMGYAAGEAAFEKIKDRFRNKPDHEAYREGFFQGFTDNASSYGLNEDLDIGHEDNEPGMLKAELYHIGSYAMELYKMMDALEGQGEVDFPAWWQSKITTAKNMISGAKHYLEFELKEPAIDDMVDGLDGIAPEMEIDVVDDENMEESIDREFHTTSNTNEHPNWKDLSAVEIQDYIDANPRTLWGRELRTAKMVIDQLKDTAVTEDTSLNDEAKAYFMGKVKRGEIDKLPEDPKAAFLAQMTKDQMDHDKETSHREGELEEDSFYTDDIKNKVVSKLMDQLKK